MWPTGSGLSRVQVFLENVISDGMVEAQPNLKVRIQLCKKDKSFSNCFFVGVLLSVASCHTRIARVFYTQIFTHYDVKVIIMSA